MKNNSNKKISCLVCDIQHFTIEEIDTEIDFTISVQCNFCKTPHFEQTFPKKVSNEF